MISIITIVSRNLHFIPVIILNALCDNDVSFQSVNVALQDSALLKAKLYTYVACPMYNLKACLSLQFWSGSPEPILKPFCTSLH